MSFADKPVLVTGAGGFIGSHLAERLVAEGARVRAMVHYNSASRYGWLDTSGVRDQMEVVVGDICDRDSVLSACTGMQVVFHLAALISIPYSYSAPMSYVRTNIEGTVNVLTAVRACGVERMVHTSTSEVYGTAIRVPIDETHPLQGQSPYSASKVGADMQAQAFHSAFDVPVVTVRPFNTFGPRQSSRAVIPSVIAQCVAGTQISIGSLHPTRDFNYVADTVDGFMCAAAAEGAEGAVVNVGSGREIRIGDLAELISEKVTGQPPNLRRDPNRTRPERSEVDRLLADNSASRELLGWTPRVSLEEGLDRTIEWIRENLDTYVVGRYDT